jgi:hypothetical protein
MEGKKHFAAGNRDVYGDVLSTNSVVDNSNISPETIHSLSIEYGFEILPKCKAADDAGYTDDDRKAATVWYGPTMDDENFYYCAFSGSINFNSYKTSILIARRRSDSSIVYAVNCNDYTLDTAPTYFGPVRTVCRMAPAIDGKTLYLVTASIANIGPQLFAVNKLTGKLKWARGFYPPEAYTENTGKKLVYETKPYSEYFASNTRLSDLNPIVVKNKKGKKCIIVGSSSNQNLINIGLLPSSPYFIGYPQYTDQGHIVALTEDGELEWRKSTCAPILKAGDKVTKGSGAKDPFRPGKTKALIGTITNTKIVNPSSEGKFAQSVYITDPSQVTSSLVADFWATFGQEIQTTDESGLFTLNQILQIWLNKAELGTPFQSVIYISGKQGLNGAVANGVHGVFYVKEISDGDILTEQDAHALNYWGNSVWGAPSTYIDYKVYYGSGQSHYIPLDERKYYSEPERDYYALKVPVVDNITAYINNQTQSNLDILNQSKDSFLHSIKTISVAPGRSPRGSLSYNDGILGLKMHKGKHLFGVRTIPSDTYNFFFSGGYDPLQLLYPNFNSPDGDACTGIFRNVKIDREYLVATTKTALCCLVDITDANGNDNSVIYSDVQYVAPDTTLGGINYQSSFQNDRVFSCCSNASYIQGSRGSQGQPEQFVSRTGEIITQSFVASVNVNDGLDVKWNQAQDFASQGTMMCYNNCVFSGDGNGTLYGRKSTTGELLWKLNTKETEWPMGGGPTSACAGGGQIIWINNYSLPALSVAEGSNGISLRVPCP